MADTFVLSVVELLQDNVNVFHLFADILDQARWRNS